MLKNAAICGVVNVHCRALVLHCKLKGNIYALFKRINFRILVYYVVNLFNYDFFDKRRHILKMIIERIAVDTAILDDIFNGNLVQRPLVQQLFHGILYRFFRKVRHSIAPLHIIKKS